MCMGRRKKVHMYIVLTLCEFMKSWRLSYLDKKTYKKAKNMYTITLMYNTKLSVHMYSLNVM